MNSEDGRESAEWLNQVMNAAWDCQRKVWSERLRAKLDGLLEMNKPKYLEDIYVDQLGLGENSPKFHSIAAHRIKRQANTNNFEMVIDAKFSYEASTANVVFVTKLRAIGVSMSLSLGSIRLMGEARITLLWHPGSATLKGMELSLRSYPTLDYVMRPLNTFDATEIPLLSGWLTDTLSTLIKNSVVNPNKICIDLSSHTNPNCDDTDQFGEVIGHIMIACPSLDNLEFFKKSSIRYSIDVTLQSPSRVQDSTSTVISTTGLTTMVVRARVNNAHIYQLRSASDVSVWLRHRLIIGERHMRGRSIFLGL
ncbi:hypothetical protein, variant [Sphaeroforma arctica JP610]|uniref:SMP-LTD domain-containing protein n=1 Tax=Sphaeroforma arctica JP610 TaxID=667725 RepID=A0A0L0FFU3_9EUKA|nr:hypothetical protein, variant [Sphaeroforma arctica JP610]KNC75346.1 hypothetical protein, variant [Sphaeroforma arctica JP610]|eukprot:XP_014149248.1 hypothetical protein, variant [Sphaeroforma arctica JP610]